NFDSGYESGGSGVDGSNVLRFPLDGLFSLLKAPNDDGQEGKKAQSGYQTCMDFIRTSFIINKQRIKSEDVSDLLNK
ncbi:hypothetical protein, partial [Wolbachia endosymbiont of Pentidionis agamae]|uniref:hypothetical protein n=1 Tax=Wolbachia endosymbiont of Pentidionis agamae TaxID=3110435 RepID=UPI002FD5A3DF